LFVPTAGSLSLPGSPQAYEGGKHLAFGAPMNQRDHDRRTTPEEPAPTYVNLASRDGSFVIGIILEITGGKLSSS